MESTYDISKYTEHSEAIINLENNYDFRTQEASLVQTLDYLTSRYTIVTSYDHISAPTKKCSTDMLFKIYSVDQDIMWVYFNYAPKSKYISIEVDNDSVTGVKSQLIGFEKLQVRTSPNCPSLKLFFHSFDRIKRSLVAICDCLDGRNNSQTTDINSPISPRSIVNNQYGSKYICGRCGAAFLKNARCPECGQLVRIDNSTADRSPRILHVGDDVSGLKIYEIINKYFGKSYSGWMKAGYDINDRYWAWFPTITKTNTRPNGNYGGTAMWSNVLSPDRKTIITVNHDEINKTPTGDSPQRRVLIFARIDGQLQFLGVFEDHHVPDAEFLTYQHNRIAQGIDLNTFQLIDEDEL